MPVPIANISSDIADLSRNSLRQEISLFVQYKGIAVLQWPSERNRLIVPSLFQFIIKNYIGNLSGSADIDYANVTSRNIKKRLSSHRNDSLLQIIAIDKKPAHGCSKCADRNVIFDQEVIDLLRILTYPVRHDMKRCSCCQCRIEIADMRVKGKCYVMADPVIRSNFKSSDINLCIVHKGALWYHGTLGKSCGT